MSLNMIYKELDSTLETFFSDIKNQTGVTIDYTNSSSDDHLIITKITFSDGTYYENANIIDIGRRVEWIAVVDDITHLFIITTQAMFIDLGDRSTDEPVTRMHDVFIVDINGTLINLKIVSGYNTYGYHLFNIPYNTRHFSGTSNSITLVPAFFYNNDDNNKGFIKNMYIEYERSFQGGLKFIDQNRNEFITLGGYLLYYNGKHK